MQINFDSTFAFFYYEGPFRYSPHFVFAYMVACIPVIFGFLFLIQLSEIDCTPHRLDGMSNELLKNCSVEAKLLQQRDIKRV